MKKFSWILLPFAALYALATDLRSYLYKRKIFYSAKFDVPTIGVGNLRVGGTGKTPHIELLINLFSPTHQIATLSRGYGRKTKGFRIASTEDTPESIGDEPMQLYEKFGDKIKVAVGEERALAIPELLYQCPQVNLILLDDAFQHLAVSPDCSILLTEYAQPFYQDFVLPMGRLRERRRAATRAHIIIVSKCPENINPEEKNEIEKNIRPYAPHSPVFFTKLCYGKPYSLLDKSQAKNIEKVILIAAIANPNYFLEKMQKQFDCQAHFFFPDHRFFKKTDIDTIAKLISEHTCLLCTEKDAPKLKNILPQNLLAKTFVVPIEVQFLSQTMQKEFLECLKRFLK
ncbi:MAG: tetraacyldisaccharide 4'-kinase [Raineya sp.]